jgi:2,4-dienoyl-CoA reductase-like NADH-dependent reductase (Old Yellow Enzyme family)
MRFLRELVRAVSPSRSREFAVSVKLNSADFQRGGFDDRDALEVLKALDAEGVDLYELSGGSYERAVMWEDRPPTQGSTLDREAFFLAFADDARKVTRTPLMVTGGFRTAQGMALAVRSGSVDLVGLARPLALEPDLPAKILTGRADRAARPSLKTGLRQLDALLEGGYHQHQLQRMGQGKDPEVHPGILGALSAAARSTLFSPRPGLAR